jgi:DNA-binding NarL/FixJ family response regulator
MPRVLTVHARPATRQAVARALGSATGVELVGQAASGAEARRILAALTPDAVTVDARLPDGDGIALAVELRAALPRLGVVVLGPTRDPQLVLRALASGLSGYLPEGVAAAELVAVLRHAATTAGSFSAQHLAAALRRAGQRTRTVALSQREREVLRLLREGLGIGAIAARLRLSESTVKTYVTRVQAKLRVASRAGLRVGDPQPTVG